MTIDLHIHSTISDGTMSPSEIVAFAAQKGISAISITDHDSVDGVGEAIDTGNILGVEVISGVELSVRYKNNSTHLLGYLFDHNSAALQQSLGLLQEGRITRNREIICRLNNLGIPVHYPELLKIAGPGECGRPHIAQLLLHKKVVRTMDEAFESYLGHGAKAYVPRFIYDAAEAIALFKDAGGLSVLAHPVQLGKTVDSFQDLLLDLVDMGLDGIEAYYPSHSRQFRKQLMVFAEQHGLLLTGGSDFHGSIRPGTTLAGGKNVSVPEHLLGIMKQRKKAIG
jgi:predicted metal-dependent phosphoesterase TrpH